MGAEELFFFNSEEEIRVGPVLPSGADMYVAVKVPFLEEKGKKKRREK